MDDAHFDRLTKTLSTAGTRRGLLSLLVALPGLGGVIDSVAAGDVDDAGGRGKRRKKGRKPGKGRRRKEQNKKPKLCRPESRATTCADTCGTVKNNCQQVIECGSCACDPPCGVCQSCQEAPHIPGECVPDPAQMGEACGAGRFCRADGRCTCDATSCAACESCQEDGVCSLPCDGEGCCADGTCAPGNTLDACGIDGESCQVCGEDELCWDGRCVCGDVCADGCQFRTIQDAIDAAEPGATIRLCAETYPRTIGITKSLTLLGVGDGEDGTVLDAQGVGTPVHTSTDAVVTLRGLRITGGVRPRGGEDGGGIINRGTLTVSDCTVTGNYAADGGGGIYNAGGGAMTLRHTRVSGNRAEIQGGGIYSTTDETLTLEDCVISGNTARRGGGIYALGAVELNHTEVSENVAQGYDGGGIAIGGSLRLTNSQVTNNTAGARGGGISNHGGTVVPTNSDITDNTAATQGGGIFNDRGTVSLTSSHVTENTAESGGGVYNDRGSVTLTDSTVADNDPDNCAGEPVAGCGG